MSLRPVLRIIGWLAATCLALVLVAVGWTMWVIASHDTTTLPADHGQVRTELFASDATQQPLLVGLGGAEGGMAWASDYWKPQRDRLLTQGYAMLALGYFGAPGAPTHLDRISLDAVHDAIVEAAKDPRIDASCVILIGGSKGAELALSLAARAPDIDAVVAIAPGMAVFPGITDAMTTSSFTWQGEPLAFVPVPWSATGALIAGDLLRVSEIMLEDREAVAAAAIPVEKIDGPILFISATQDEFWPSQAMSDAMMARLDAHEFAHAHEHIAVPGSHANAAGDLSAVDTFLAETVMTAPGGDCRPEAR